MKEFDLDEIKKEMDALPFTPRVFEITYMLIDKLREQAEENAELKVNVYDANKKAEGWKKKAAYSMEETDRYAKENDELKEYKWMYEGLG